MTANATDIQALLHWLYDLQRLGIKVGLTHTRDLAAACGNPQLEYPLIHIAGTNGKGSTAATIAAILRTAGHRVGLYTSPHLIRFNERIRVDGTPIADADIVDFITSFRLDIDRIQSTFFEATTALAFWYFARCQVTVAVIETGLGGRLDSTNIVQPAVTVITPVDIDHTEYLGRHIVEIAREKGGIIKDGVPLVLAPQTAEVAIVLKEIAGQRNAAIIPVRLPQQEPKVDLAGGTTFRWRAREFTTPLLGQHQMSNAVTALEAVRAFDRQIPDEIIHKGLKTVKWPGRMQLLSRKPVIFYDVAHNAHGIRSALAGVRQFSTGEPIGLLALKADKDIGSIAAVLRGAFKYLVVTSSPDHGLMTAERLAASLTEQGVCPDEILPIEAAFDRILELTGGGRTGLIFGSHYIADKIYLKFGFLFEDGLI
ncbi:MAG: folylpolyglutamate synthase/dihydrofolate synthase family protein [Candidatus Neomarinimicrobiota bacterium]